MDELAEPRANIFERKRAAQQTDATVDVKSNAARRNDSLLDVDSGNTPDRKTISLMNVRHRKRPPDDSGQHRHIRRLLQGLVAANRFEQEFICIDDGVRQHAGLGRSWNQPAVIVDLFEM